MNYLFALFSVLTVLGVSCQSSSTSQTRVSSDSVDAGSSVSMGAERIQLYPGKLRVGDNFSSLARRAGLEVAPAVAVINIVPSIDTPVCEEQTHILGESSACIQG